MSSTSFRLIVHQSVNPDGLAQFRELAQRGAAGAQANEPGTLGYEFFLSEDGSDCYLNEYYESDQAFLDHFERVQPILQESMKVSTLVEAVVLGDPGAEARAMLDHLGAKYYSDCIGFCR